MSALDELASFVARYCAAHVDTLGAAPARAVAVILTTGELPFILDMQAVLYGFADEVSATHSEEFDPAWRPAGCR